MRKILIAEASKELGMAMVRCLETEYSVTYCCDGRDVVARFNENEPELLVLDLCLPNMDGITILSMLRSAGKNLPVVVLTPNLDDHVLMSLRHLRVSRVFLVPCSMDTLLCGVRMVASQTDAAFWDVETELDNILLLLGFRMGRTRYENVRTAILLKFYGEIGGVTKCLYPAVASRHGGNALQVEKSIRDAIRHAFRMGNRENWKLYFSGCLEDVCPSNELFIARIACALKTRSRMYEMPHTKRLKAENE